MPNAEEGSTHHEEDIEEELFVPKKSPNESSKTGTDDAIAIAKEIVNRAIDSNAGITFMSFVTTYALYGDDVRIIAFDPGADGTFLVLSSLAFVFFLVEFCLLCWCRERYLQRPDFAAMRELLTADRWRGRTSTFDWMGEFGKALQAGSFYFWLDLVSTFSMAIEIPWILRPDGDVAGTIDSTIAGKASRAGAKAANKLKVIRMVRLVRLAKLYKYISAKQSARVQSDTVKKSAGKSDAAKKSVGKSISHLHGSLDLNPPESHVGAEMSDRTTKKVIVGILIMLLGIPLLQIDEVDYLNELSMKMTFEHRKLIPDGGISGDEFDQWEFSESLLVDRTDCIDITYKGFDDGLRNDTIIPSDRSRLQDLRVEELDVFTIGDFDFVRSMTVVFDASERIWEEALLGILLTSFVIVLLGLGMVSFTKDVRNLVIVPIERMIQLVNEISENPLGKDFSLKVDDKNNKDDGMETTLLIRTISKIAGLMRVGFGEAGADIIGKNLNISNGTDAMNLLGNGRKIHSIFGFCDVRQFTDTTECLQEEVMLFVNRIAHILHSIVVQCDGAANKNIGDAFLLTWKVNTNQLAGSCKDHDYAGDKALYSFVKTMIEMNRHEDFLCKFTPHTLSKLYERMPGYKCRIGCGLHFGWAIEGAIGSSKKIDASYISPHVNMSETLESATKQYGTSILMSEPFFNLLSTEAVVACRKVDMIKKRKSDTGTGLYTYDVDLNVDFSPGDTGKEKPRTSLPHHRRTTFSLLSQVHGPKSERSRESQLWGGNSEGMGDLPKIEISNDSNNFPDIWTNDREVVCVRSRFKNYSKEWRLGMDAFEAGQWDVAHEHFNHVLKKSGGKDGPSRYLLGRMEEYNYCAPDSW
eukprot:CAMPEP_0181134474 /NCGR_PEP_ID=MMETSP1071-20121207/32108_1 /TAXON_ID=35127 /ORGANISM="Thalassiosira sp., Strain NH16" /LENGTH=864 /DNA_ID=CAMNT_0023220997 /DNA_START=56 /DNA_END=2647 /DNA_ORIENTATION=-